MAVSFSAIHCYCGQLLLLRTLTVRAVDASFLFKNPFKIHRYRHRHRHRRCHPNGNGWQESESLAIARSYFICLCRMRLTRGKRGLPDLMQNTLRDRQLGSWLEKGSSRFAANMTATRPHLLFHFSPRPLSRFVYFFFSRSLIY